jgi:hypothetical protein
VCLHISGHITITTNFVNGVLQKWIILARHDCDCSNPSAGLSAQLTLDNRVLVDEGFDVLTPQSKTWPHPPTLSSLTQFFRGGRSWKQSKGTSSDIYYLNQRDYQLTTVTVVCLCLLSGLSTVP